jgi:ribosomal protein S18 acetylase RimI-like enzyme
MSPAQIPTALASAAPSRLVIDQPTPMAELEAGSLVELLQLLGELGISGKMLLDLMGPLDLTQVAAVFEYLKYAVLMRDGTAAQLQFHLELLASLSSDNYPDWMLMARELSEDGPFTPEVNRFIQKAKVSQFLNDNILRKLGLTNASKFRPHENEKQFILFALIFLESVTDITTSDPLVALLFEAVNRYGSLSDYFKGYDPARQASQKVASAGFTASYLLGESTEIYTQNSSELYGEQREWGERLNRLALRLLGDQTTLPELDLGIDRFKLSNQLKPQLDAARRGDKNAAGKGIDQLLPILELREQQFKRTGNRIAASKAGEFIRSLQTIQNQIRPVDEKRMELRAQHKYQFSVRHSGKQIPELFFDDDRFASWLFKPGGLVQGEISRLLLDPTTPMTEFWLYPHFVFMGLAALFPGYNTRRQPTILIDSFNYDEQLLDAFGLERTLEYVLDGLVIDASRAGAANLAVFAAASGRAADLPQYIQRTLGQLKSITYYDSYPFEAVDPSSSGLAQSVTGAFHATECFGYGNPLSGVIDFPFNQVTYVSVEKNTAGPRGVFEIEVRGYLTERKLMDKMPEPQYRPGNQPPEGGRTSPTAATQSREGGSREQQAAIDSALAVMRSAVPGITIEQHKQQVDERLSSELVELHTAAFPDYAQYRGQEYAQRIVQPNAELYILRAGERVAGLALWHTTPLLPVASLYIDELAIHPAFQARGLGGELLRLLARIAGMRGYRQLYLLTRMDAPAARLLRFYDREGFHFIGQYEGLGNLLMRHLSLTGPENARALAALQNRLEIQVSDRLSVPRVTLHSVADLELLNIMRHLERTFPEPIRYSETEFVRRFTFPDAFVLLLRDGSVPVAFAFCYNDPLLPADFLFADSMAVDPQYQKRGIGTDFVRAVLAIPSATFYKAVVFFCTEWNHDGVNLPEYYARFGAKLLDRMEDRLRMVIPIAEGEQKLGEVRDITDHRHRPGRIDPTSAQAALSSSLSASI